LRWKLLIAAPLAAAAVGAGVCAAVARMLARPGGAPAATWAVGLALLAPLASVIYASVFVYRHTARRRTLQAAATALLASLLTLTALLLGSLLTTGRATELLLTPQPAARRR
jgi:hypothetical protein